MFRETITHAGGTTTGEASEKHAEMLLLRATRREYRIEATRQGGALISWTARRFGTGEQIIKIERAILLVPHRAAGAALTDTTLQDLDLIDSYRHSEYRPVESVILCGLWRIPPAATARLLARGLVGVDKNGRAWVTLATRLALVARDHRTTTTEPDGWHRPADSGVASAGLNKPGRRAGLLYSSASTALCECGFHAFAGDRTEARRLAADHRAEAAAAFVRSLAPSLP
ncbi:hypothetical protein [Streptomyces kronopolitis]|uniref:hypothetical protein n=1 Tax=Streptomyces kronopolitis TaxID=1612435 RepID=UPI00343BA143